MRETMDKADNLEKKSLNKSYLSNKNKETLVSVNLEEWRVRAVATFLGLNMA